MYTYLLYYHLIYVKLNVPWLAELLMGFMHMGEIHVDWTVLPCSVIEKVTQDVKSGCMYCLQSLSWKETR